MATKLTVVVTCTDRKSARPPAELRVRSLPKGNINERFEHWTARLAAASDKLPLRALYQGEAWSQVARLELALGAAGFEPTVVVASAGLGLQPLTSSGPSYSATYAAGQADSVGADRTENQAWWRLLLDHSGVDASAAFAKPTLFVLSESYAQAMASDLRCLRDRDDVLVFGGAGIVPPHQRVPADLGLRRALGGTATSINLRMATAWASRLNGRQLVSERIRLEWEAWVREVRVAETYDRQPLTDDALIALIKDLRSTEPSISKTRALRRLRDSGVACEQRRFGELFQLSGRP
jgi:hypothetical protein